MRSRLNLEIIEATYEVKKTVKKGLENNDDKEKVTHLDKKKEAELAKIDHIGHDNDRIKTVST